jgi:hypothetical protein
MQAYPITRLKNAAKISEIHQNLVNSDMIEIKKFGEFWNSNLKILNKNKNI